ncbi:hypothetical protein GQ43DRAFT_476797 [Delitschia confertaspora ATCC 74209]|uniref:Uncharacterized protein n=1 Tax=Delitschia confertaspora ATCC 74209 TaxID=1513339 RepID=A0A9P4MTA1_9PLEO|nr:hypothetical protein GQ43DRAFT_476797 [Delitschia confertaspora ATCC 74209]
MTLTPPKVYILATVLTVIGTLAVLVRLYVHRIKRDTLRSDDWTAVVGLLGYGELPQLS